ncbi:restriction endonuclease [Streptomyces sp. NPDC052020]|uniref:restriction endonuclease n=1 Tax=Streptomyces sp. NPDC052020 TaxID=3155677 RepID=UPI00341F964C
MAVPARRIRSGRRRQPFDLRRTAVFFGLLAILLIIVGFAVRTAADLVDRRPAWALVLGLAGGAGALFLWHRRHRLSVARAARRAGAALDEAARTAVDAWEGPARPGPPGAEQVVGETGGGRPVAAAPAGRPGAVEYTAAAGPTAAVDGGAAVTGPASDADYAALDPDEFEHAVAALCVRDGCREAEVVGGAGDLGADVLAVAPDGRRVVIQCKRYGDGTTVGSQDLQRFGGTCFAVHGADVAVVVTTSAFTAPAIDYARQCGIVCVDGEALRAWRAGAGPRPWEAPGAEGRPR